MQPLRERKISDYLQSQTGRLWLEVFRHAATEDNLTLLETTDLEGAVTSARNNSPTVVIFERGAFGPDSDAGVRAVHEAIGGDAAPAIRHKRATDSPPS